MRIPPCNVHISWTWDRWCSSLTQKGELESKALTFWLVIATGLKSHVALSALTINRARFEEATDFHSSTLSCKTLYFLLSLCCVNPYGYLIGLSEKVSLNKPDLGERHKRVQGCYYYSHFFCSQQCHRQNVVIALRVFPAKCHESSVERVVP